MTDLVQARPRFRWPHPAERETTLYLVRHGRTKGNVDRTLCGRLDVPLDDLAEWNFGDYEGKTLAEVMSTAPQVLKALENIEDDDVGWPGGEIRRKFHARVAGVFRQIAGDYHSQSVVVVAHGGVLGSLAAQIHGQQPNDWAAYNFHNCSLSHVSFSAEGVDVVMINDVAHLAELVEIRNGG